MRPHRHVDTTVLDTSALLAVALGGTAPDQASVHRPPALLASPVGAWRSADGAVCLQIKTDGTYAGRVAGRKREPHGTYAVDGTTMTLSDVSGLHTPVTMLNGELEMAGHRLTPA
jgi:hypothetical protein